MPPTVRGKIVDVISAEFIERAGMSERSRTSEGTERKLFIPFPFEGRVDSAGAVGRKYSVFKPRGIECYRKSKKKNEQARGRRWN